MLHQINAPLCNQEMERIVQFQYQVLTFACNPDGPLELTEQVLQETFGADIGSWLYRKPTIRQHLTNWITYTHNHPDAAQQILSAFNNDIGFLDHLDDPDFRFCYHTLLDEAKQIVRPLLIAFYENLLRNGFPQCVHGNAEILDRDAFIAAFWEANPKLVVCPACDCPRSSKVDDKVYADADHFLPKSNYPFLSVHPANLIPLCLDCNRSFKGERDPIDLHDDAPLINTFHPYHRPAINHVSANVSRDSQMVHQIDIVDNTTGATSRRTDSLDRVFKLSGRWKDVLSSHVIQTIRDELAHAGVRERKRVDKIDRDQFMIELTDMLRNTHERVGKRNYHVLHVSYLRYAMSDEGEFLELLAQFNGE